MVMEIMRGGTLGDRLQSGRQIPHATALRWLREAAAALDTAHDAGVVHRDIKPGNLLLDEHERLAVADFGIARVAWEDQLTADGRRCSARPPTCRRSRRWARPPSAASDRYALAVVAYELLTGTRPFEAEHFAAQARAHVEDPPPPASERAPELSAAVDAVLERGLAKRPGDRWPSAVAFVDALERTLGEAHPAPPPPKPTRRVRAAPAAPPPRRPAAGAGNHEPSARGRRGAALVAGVAALALVAVIAAIALVSRGGDGNSPARAAAITKPKASATATASDATAAKTETPTATPTATRDGDADADADADGDRRTGRDADADADRDGHADAGRDRRGALRQPLDAPGARSPGAHRRRRQGRAREPQGGCRCLRRLHAGRPLRLRDVRLRRRARPHRPPAGGDRSARDAPAALRRPKRQGQGAAQEGEARRGLTRSFTDQGGAGARRCTYMAAQQTKPRILCVDDEPLVLEGLRDSLRRSFDVCVATSGADGLALLRENRRGYAVVISDMRMPAMHGAAFLSEAKRVAPLTVRMLLTGHADADAAIAAVNDGQIFRFLTKPCDRDELIRACAGALWQHRVQVAERDLLEQTLHGSVKALTDVLALANPAAFGRGGRLKEIVGALARETGRDDAWEVEVASDARPRRRRDAPPTTAEKLYAGAILTADEQRMAARVPGVTLRILGNIPRLEGVLQIIGAYRRRFDSSRHDGVVPVGARMLRIASDFLRLESERGSPALALDTMRGREGVYDPDMLDAFARTIGIARRGQRVREVPVCDLQVGMTIVSEVRAGPGHLLIARGFPVTPELIDRLRNFPEGYVRQPLCVSFGA